MTKDIKFTEQDLWLDDYLINKILGGEMAVEYMRLIQGVVKAAKEDVKLEKENPKNDSTENLDKFIDELGELYTKLDLNHHKNLRIVGKMTEEELAEEKSKLKDNLEEIYPELKKYMKEYAIFEVNNSYSETFIKGIKNCVADIFRPLISFVNEISKMTSGVKIIPDAKLKMIDNLKQINTSLVQTGKVYNGQGSTKFDFVQRVVENRSENKELKNK